MEGRAGGARAGPSEGREGEGWVIWRAGLGELGRGRVRAGKGKGGSYGGQGWGS